jgi:DNA-binding XRE family transcriptional regulator
MDLYVWLFGQNAITLLGQSHFQIPHFMDNSLQNELRQKMRELRDISGYSQKDLADAMEITQPSFFKVQNGDIELAFKHISGCAELFCITPTEFILLSADELSMRIKRKSPYV